MATKSVSQSVTITLPLKSCAYPIYIGDQISLDASLLTTHLTGHQVVIITQQNIAQHYLSAVMASLTAYQCAIYYLPNGEIHKNMAEWQKLMDFLIAQQLERSATLVALGGGIVSDITGFAAACFKRGIHYINMPTTLIGQVDAAIGGKTGVNHLAGKNLFGAFYQPQSVIVDIAYLRTLPKREYIAGMAEMIKYALIYDAEFFTWLSNNCHLLLRQDTNALLYAIEHCLRIKVALVTEDEKDSGIRQLLNFGHTFGHAIEAAYSYEDILHGEAVAIGMALAAELSLLQGWLPFADVAKIKKLIAGFELPTSLPRSIPKQNLLQMLKQDKKVLAGEKYFILLTAIGQAVRTSAATDEQILAIL
jgi:3-dehydroquinate synthase